MAKPPDRSLRFVHQGWEQPERPPGVEVAPTGALGVATDAEAVTQSIRMILTTAPGERVMRPDYGCRIHSLVFEPNDATTAGLAVHYVTQALQRWEPRIHLESVDADPDEVTPSMLNMRVVYRVKATQELAELGWTLDLGGA